jgi:hypothetical protein
MGSQHHLHKLLTSPGGPLGQLARASREHELVRNAVRRLLPSELAAALHGAVVDDACLRLGVSAGVWAARLRFLAPQLRRRLIESPDWPWGAVETIEVHVAAPATPSAPVAPTLPQPLSAASRDHLRAVARATADPRLAAALHALAGAADG